MKITLLLFIIFLFTDTALSQSISGIIKDKNSGEYIASATIALYPDSTLKSPLRGTYSNKFGFFALAKVEPGDYFLRISFIGKNPYIAAITVKDDNIFNNYELDDRNVTSGEVVVTAERDISSVRTISTVDIDPMIINKLPSLGGEKDVFRVLQLLPGVHQGSEISSGLYVRGGTPDQNLVLLDGVTVYNPTHLGGFLSSFNSDALRNITLIKGAFPAEYGGRLSSVLDMSMKEGTKENLSGTAAISMITSKFTLEGPITDNSTFMISARRMYLDLLIGLFTTKEDRELTPNYYFYDLNLKTNLQISEKDRLFVSGFFASDVLDSPDDEYSDYFDIGWSNTTGNLRWMHIASPTLFTNFSLIYTNYNFSTRLGDRQSKIEFRTETGIEDFTLRGEAEYFPSKKHKIKSGIEATYHNFIVNTIEGLFSELIGDLNTARNLNSLDLSYYLQDEWDISDRLKSNIGMRFNLFTRGSYFNAEPRISLKYALDDISFLKAAFGVANQPLHLVYRNEVNLPTDSWIPVSDRIEPGRSWQAVIGYERAIWEDYFFSVEAYYKDMSNIYEYSDTASYFSTASLEDQLTKGRSDAWGIEFFLEKRIGNLRGWIGYTYSKTLRYFDDLNGGKPFYPRHDRTHDAKIVATYSFGEGWEIGATWVYGTGQAYTVPTGRRVDISSDYSPGNYYDYFEFSERNGYRMPAYHRMDVNFIRKFSWFNLPWEFSINIYNVYNRKNPFAIYLDQDWETNEYQLKQITLFSIIPTFGLSVIF